MGGEAQPPAAKLETDLCVVLCTCPERDAERLARGLLEARLAACVARFPGVISVYRWKAELHEEEETQLVVKTTRARFAEVLAYLGKNHPYEVPEILCVPVLEASPAYAAWVAGETDPAR